MQYISVRSIASRLSDDFGVDMDIFAVIRACSDALKKMGMFALSRFVYVADVKDFKILLPKVWKVRGVIRLDGNWKTAFSGTIIIDDRVRLMQPQIIFKEEETDVSTEPVMLKANIIPNFRGPFIAHVWKNPIIEFNETDITVAVECTGIMLDDEGFPMLPEEAFFGCLYYSLFKYYQPRVIAGQIDPNRFQLITQWKDQNISQSVVAGMMTALTSNQRNELLDIMSSMDRKAFGYPV